VQPEERFRRRLSETLQLSKPVRGWIRITGVHKAPSSTIKHH